MRKLSLLCFLSLLLNIIYAQSHFELKPDGFVDRKDSTKNYIVINYEGKTQQELFTMFLEKFTIMYVSPQNVISSVPNSTITINGFTSDDISYNIFHTYNMNYSIVFQFKEGKVRINGMSINQLFVSYEKFYREVTIQDYINVFSYKRSIYNEKGVLRDKELKEQLEVFFNTQIGRILSTGSDNQDW